MTTWSPAVVIKVGQVSGRWTPVEQSDCRACYALQNALDDTRILIKITYGEPMELKTARLTVLVDPAKKKAFETLCARQDVTPSQVVRRLIRDYLVHHGVSFVPSGLDQKTTRQPSPEPAQDPGEPAPRSARHPLTIRLTSALVNAEVVALPPTSPVRTLSRLRVASMLARRRVASSKSLQ